MDEVLNTFKGKIELHGGQLNIVAKSQNKGFQRLIAIFQLFGGASRAHQVLIGQRQVTEEVLDCLSMRIKMTYLLSHEPFEICQPTPFIDFIMRNQQVYPRFSAIGLCVANHHLPRVYELFPAGRA